jgi:hypothetical protein
VPSPIFFSGAPFMATLAMTKTLKQVVAQLPSGVRINRGLVILVRDIKFGFIGLHSPQCPRDLLQRPQPTQRVRQQRLQQPVGVKLRRRPGVKALRLATRPCTTQNVDSIAGIARPLAAIHRWAALQGQRNQSWNYALPQYPSQSHAPLSLYLSKSSPYLDTLPLAQSDSSLI